VVFGTCQEENPVLVYKLVGKENESAKSKLASLVEQLSQLSGEAFYGSVLKLVVILKADNPAP
jgi:hypothetical protein